ncbi:hypothetical protein TNCV_1249351 [Trichonephila clavipes]|nr:hypothetical protein TNCV_1249351 [Trichonephila clavipes]
MDVGKSILPERHGGTLNSRPAANPFVRLVEGEKSADLSSFRVLGAEDLHASLHWWFEIYNQRISDVTRRLLAKELVSLILNPDQLTRTISELALLLQTSTSTRRHRALTDLACYIVIAPLHGLSSVALIFEAPTRQRRSRVYKHGHAATTATARMSENEV